MKKQISLPLTSLSLDLIESMSVPEPYRTEFLDEYYSLSFSRAFDVLNKALSQFGTKKTTTSKKDRANIHYLQGKCQYFLDNMIPAIELLVKAKELGFADYQDQDPDPDPDQDKSTDSQSVFVLPDIALLFTECLIHLASKPSTGLPETLDKMDTYNSLILNCFPCVITSLSNDLLTSQNQSHAKAVSTLVTDCVEAIVTIMRPFIETTISKFTSLTKGSQSKNTCASLLTRWGTMFTNAACTHLPFTESQKLFTIGIQCLETCKHVNNTTEHLAEAYDKLLFFTLTALKVETDKLPDQTQTRTPANPFVIQLIDICIDTLTRWSSDKKTSHSNIRLLFTNMDQLISAFSVLNENNKLPFEYNCKLIQLLKDILRKYGSKKGKNSTQKQQIDCFKQYNIALQFQCVVYYLENDNFYSAIDMTKDIISSITQEHITPPSILLSVSPEAPMPRRPLSLSSKAATPSSSLPASSEKSYFTESNQDLTIVTLAILFCQRLVKIRHFEQIEQKLTRLRTSKTPLERNLAAKIYCFWADSAPLEEKEKAYEKAEKIESNSTAVHRFCMAIQTRDYAAVVHYYPRMQTLPNTDNYSVIFHCADFIEEVKNVKNPVAAPDLEKLDQLISRIKTTRPPSELGFDEDFFTSIKDLSCLCLKLRLREHIEKLIRNTVYAFPTNKSLLTNTFTQLMVFARRHFEIIRPVLASAKQLHLTPTEPRQNLVILAGFAFDLAKAAFPEYESLWTDSDFAAYACCLFYIHDIQSALTIFERPKENPLVFECTDSCALADTLAGLHCRLKMELKINPSNPQLEKDAFAVYQLGSSIASEYYYDLKRAFYYLSNLEPPLALEKADPVVRQLKLCKKALAPSLMEKEKEAERKLFALFKKLKDTCQNKLLYTRTMLTLIAISDSELDKETLDDLCKCSSDMIDLLVHNARSDLVHDLIEDIIGYIPEELISIDLLLSIGVYYAWIGNYNEVEAAFIRAIKKNPLYPKINLCLGTASFLTHSFEKAETSFFKEIDSHLNHRNPIESSTLMYYSITQLLLNNKPEAIRLCELSLDKNNPHKEHLLQIINDFNPIGYDENGWIERLSRLFIETKDCEANLSHNFFVKTLLIALTNEDNKLAYVRHLCDQKAEFQKSNHPN
ncbi:tetratricopeptide repeat protein [Thermoproteota archaeon]